jgi:hypothetical protein
MLFDAQLEKINLQASFAKEQDQLEMIRILHAARVESGNGKKLDLELLFNQVGEYLNLTRRLRRKTGRCKQHYQPKFARQVMRT